MYPELILASASASRKSLLTNAGLNYIAVAAELDERAIETKLQSEDANPQRVALELAKAKAISVSLINLDAIVIGSDQTMSLDDMVFHKPKNMKQAFSHLRLLSGKTHQLNSAVALAINGEIVWSTISSAELTVRDLSDVFIEKHLSIVGEKALTSVGAYQLEGEGIQLFNSICGDYFTILGLPLLPLLAQLREMAVIDG